MFQEDWDDFQFSFLGANGLTEHPNAGRRSSKASRRTCSGRRPTRFTSIGGFALQKAEARRGLLRTTYEQDPTTGKIVNDCDDPLAQRRQDSSRRKARGCPPRPSSRRASPGATSSRWPASMRTCRASVVHNGDSATALLPAENDVLGKSDAYTLVDLSFGIGREKWGAELFVENAFDERAVLSRFTDARNASVDPICGGIDLSA